MSVIRIKRSGSTGSPAALAQGEMGYSFLTGTQSNGGDRLYIGTGTEVGGIAANIEVIGGKYFTSMLDHTHGTLTANSALIVDGSGKLDILNVDNITINGNSITSTNTNGNIVLDPAGTGVIDVSAAKVTNAADPVDPSDLVTLSYLTGSLSGISSVLNIVGDAGTDAVNLSTDTLTFVGGTGLSSAVTNNVVTINLDNTAVSAGSYGSATVVPAFTVDAQGRLTSVTATAIAIPSTQITDFAEATQDIVGGMLTGTQSGISVTYTDSTGVLNFDVNDPTITLTGDVTGSAVMTNLGDVTITATIAANSVALGTDTTGNYVATVGVTAGTGLSVSGSGVESGAVVLAGVDATTSTKGVATFNATNFSVAAGVVTTNAVTIGSTTVNNGGTVTTLAGLTSVTSGNLTIATNEISATNTNGDVSIKPDGTGTVSVNNKRITGLAEPINATDAVTKQYADSIATGLHLKEGVDAATTTTLAIHSGGTVTYDNGASGVGATLTLSVALTSLDDHTLINGDRVLIKNEANQTHNGIYVRTSSTVFTRDVLFDSDEDVEGGDFVFVVEGTVNGGTAWVQSATVNIIGTDAIVFQQFSGGQTIYAAGAGLTLTGTEFDVNVDSSSIEISADTLRVKALGITNDMLAGSITNAKLTNSTISGVALGSNLNTLTFNSGLTGGSYNGSTPVTVSVDATSTNTVSKIVTRDASGNFAAGTITAALNGNASTATTLQTSRTITLSGDVTGSVSFNGSSDVTITASIASNSVALGTDTTGNYAADVSVGAGTGLSITGAAGEGTSFVLSGIDATTSVKGVASFDSTNFTVSSGAVSITSIDGGTY